MLATIMVQRLEWTLVFGHVDLMTSVATCANQRACALTTATSSHILTCVSCVSMQGAIVVRMRSGSM